MYIGSNVNERFCWFTIEQKITLKLNRKVKSNHTGKFERYKNIELDPTICSHNNIVTSDKLLNFVRGFTGIEDRSGAAFPRPAAAPLTRHYVRYGNPSQ